MPEPLENTSTAVIKLEPRPVFYGGAALPEPVRFQCGPGRAALGDWAALGMACYSGIVRYGQNHLARQRLDDRLRRGWKSTRRPRPRCSSTDGGSGVVLASPGRIDVAGLLVEGQNRIEIRVADTLANHYSVGKPCGHRYIRPGQTRSGLFSCRLQRAEKAGSP